MVRYRHLIVIASVLVGWLGDGLVAAEPSFERIFGVDPKNETTG